VSITIGCSVLPPIFRARIDGAVTRFPGTGDGVARLVDVSMVKVDMARLSNDRAITPPVLPFRTRNEGNLDDAARVGTTSALAGVAAWMNWSIR
jgi:hypothetical protein